MNWQGHEDRRRSLAFAYGRRLTCKRCKAKPGKHCTTKGGEKARLDHAERYYPGRLKATDANWKPPQRMLDNPNARR